MYQHSNVHSPYGHSHNTPRRRGIIRWCRQTRSIHRNNVILASEKGGFDYPASRVYHSLLQGSPSNKVCVISTFQLLTTERPCHRWQFHPRAEEVEGATSIAEFCRDAFPGWLSTIILHGAGLTTSLPPVQGSRATECEVTPAQISLSSARRQVRPHMDT